MSYRDDIEGQELLEAIEDGKDEQRYYKRLFRWWIAGALFGLSAIGLGITLSLLGMATSEALQGLAVPGSFVLIGCCIGAAYVYTEPLRDCHEQLRKVERQYVRWTLDQ